MSQGTTTFSERQYDHAYPPGLERHWWCLARTRIVDILLRDGYAGSDSILEIGCGRGMVVDALRRLGHDCRGIELAPVDPLPAVRDAVRTGCDALALPVAERNAVRTILLLDVLEHLDEPAAFLARLRSGFPALRRLLVTVPARSELWSNYDEYYAHKLRSGLADLARLARDGGFTLRYAGYAFRLAYLPAWFLARTGVRRPVELRAPEGAAAILAHRIVQWICWVEWRLLPSWLPGSSAIACFRQGDG